MHRGTVNLRPPGRRRGPRPAAGPAGRGGSRVWAAARWRPWPAGPGRERLAEVPVVGILGRDGQALPFGERAGEGVVGGGEVFDPLAYFRDLLPDGQGELVALGLGGGLGFGRAQRRVVLAGVAAAEFGVGGHGQVALGAGGGVPVGPVGHDGGEDGLAVPVGLVQGLVAVAELLLLSGVVVLAAAGGGCGFGAGADGGQAGVPGGGADLAELVADVLGCPGGFDGVGVAQVQQPARRAGRGRRARRRGRGRRGPRARRPAGPGRPRRARARWARWGGGSRRVPARRRWRRRAFCQSSRSSGCAGTGPRALTAQGRACSAACSPIRSLRASISAAISVT